MAIYKKGADTAALRACAERVSAYSRELDGIRGDASRAVRGLKGQWGGGDLDTFLGRWPSTEASLVGCGTTFDSMAQALRRNAGAQDDTSGAGSAFSPNPSGGGGAGGGGDRNPANPTGDDDLGDYEDIGAIPMDDDDLEMVDIEQGQIGDCWMLAALGPIARDDPQFIRDHVQYDAEAGTYTVTLYDDGEPVEVTVDASVIEGGARDPEGNPNYASIYEKAMASFHGGTYDDIDGGYSSDAFETITGRDAVSGGESSFDDIEANLADGDLMAVGTEDDDAFWFWEDEVDDSRIVPNHAYMVDQVAMHDGERMIHLVNPWGPDGGMMEGDDNQKVGDIWLTEEQYRENFDSTYSVPGKGN